MILSRTDYKPERRIRRRFLWLPLRPIYSAETRWLEVAEVVEVRSRIWIWDPYRYAHEEPSTTERIRMGEAVKLRNPFAQSA